jgi:hypothetical protein
MGNTLCVFERSVLGGTGAAGSFFRLLVPDGFFNGGILSWKKARACLPLFVRPDIFHTKQVGGHPADTG